MSSYAKTFSEYKGDQITYNHIKVERPLEYDLPVHTHDVCEMLLIKSGNVSGVINAKSYELTKNCLIIFRANIPHRIMVNDNTDYERYDIIFDENSLANKVFCKLSEELNIINLNGNSQVIELFKKLDYYCDNFIGSDLKCVVTNVVEEILFNLSIIRNVGIGSHLISSQPILCKGIDYIDSHYTEDIKIEDISKHLSVTKSHLHHLFTDNLHISPKKFINIKRLSKAQGLIRMGEAPSSVYLNCGFNDYTTFFRSYVSYFGHSPSDENKMPIERKLES